MKYHSDLVPNPAIIPYYGNLLFKDMVVRQVCKKEPCFTIGWQVGKIYNKKPTMLFLITLNRMLIELVLDK